MIESSMGGAIGSLAFSPPNRVRLLPHSLPHCPRIVPPVLLWRAVAMSLQSFLGSAGQCTVEQVYIRDTGS